MQMHMMIQTDITHTSCFCGLTGTVLITPTEEGPNNAGVACQVPTPIRWITLAIVNRSELLSRVSCFQGGVEPQEEVELGDNTERVGLILILTLSRSLNVLNRGDLYRDFLLYQTCVYHIPWSPHGRLI